MTENLFQIRVSRVAFPRVFRRRVRIGHLVMDCSKKYVVSCDDGDANPSCSDPFSDGRQGEIIYISPWGKCQSIVVEHPSYSLILRIAIVESSASRN